jgi:hypothetical protein
LCSFRLPLTAFGLDRAVDVISAQGKAYEGIIAHFGQSFQCHVVYSLDRKLVVLLNQDGTHEAYDVSPTYEHFK